MSEPDLRDADLHRLSRLMGLGPDGGSSWSQEELGDVLHHQLRAPLLFDLGKLSGVPEAELRGRVAAGRIESFGDLLSHAAPPVELLLLVKEFCKSSTEAGGLPREVSTLLYYATIAAALVRHGRRITRMDDATLCQGLQWAAEQPWADETTRRLVRDAVARLHAGGAK